MQVSLHTASILYTNIATDIKVARDAGYDGVELWIPKLTRYLDAGFSVADLVAMLGPLQVTMLDVIMPFESTDPQIRRRLVSKCQRIAPIAAQLGCNALQAVALDGFLIDDWPEQRRVLIQSLTELSELTQPHGVRLAIEPVSFSRFYSIPQALEVINEVGPDRAGLVLDTWHLWTGGQSCEQIAKIDADLVISAQIGDSAPQGGASWSDDDRAALPGDGVAPLHELIDAILRTGYSGAWSVEVLSKRHREWEPQLLATEMLRKARALLNDITVADE